MTQVHLIPLDYVKGAQLQPSTDMGRSNLQGCAHIMIELWEASMAPGLSFHCHKSVLCPGTRINQNGPTWKTFLIC